MASSFRYIILSTLYGVIYIQCEIFWKRGFDQLHWSMFVLAAINGTIVGLLNDRYSYEMDLTLQYLIGGILVTIGEGIVGHIFNTNYTIWDYRALPLSFWNAQINLLFSLIWAFILCPIAIIIDDLYDYYILKSDDRPYYKLCGKVLFVMPERRHT